MNGYNGLISWSGTAFEYLMPNVILRQEEGSLLDESIKFMIMSQKEYAKKLDIPWGFSESAYYLKDLNGNFQYKAIGIPWLGLKRGLEEDIVVSSYASLMAITENPKDVLSNIKKLDNEGMYGKFGFYEAIDYTPIRIKKGEKYSIVSNYMAHHQALILLSINNLFSNSILQNRFSLNPEVEAIKVLLQETMPEKRIITKEEKTKPEKIKYQDYENYTKRVYTKSKQELPICNVIANSDYSIVMNEKLEGYSKYKNYFINKFKNTSDISQGIFFYIKNIKDKRIWGSSDKEYLSRPDKYELTFTEDSDKLKRIDGPIESICKVTLSSNTPVEIRTLSLKNYGIEEQTMEITSVIEPVLDTLEGYNSHPAFKNLFLVYEYLEEENIFIIKRKNRENTNKGLYLAVSLYSKDETIGNLEYEIDKEKFEGRGNFNIPNMVQNSIPFSKKIQFVTDPILALRKTICLKPEQTANFNLIISVSEDRQTVIENVREYQNEEKIKKAFELSIARADTEARYLRLNTKQIEVYQKLLGYILFSNPIQTKKIFKDEYYGIENLWKYGISGDLPILLVKIKDSNEIEVLEEVIKAYEFFRLKNIEIDLVILNMEPNSYERYTKGNIQNVILNANLEYMENIKGGIFVLENSQTSNIEFYANFVIDTSKGPLVNQIRDMEDEYLENIEKIGQKVPTKYEIDEEESNISIKDKSNELLYYNEYGGFSPDGKEYLICIDKDNRLPTVWSHILANEKFGTLVTDSMGGFTWYKNSKLNKITSYSNNQVTDEPSEAIFIQEQESLKTWSIGLNPMPDNKEYKVNYGFGYANYEHISMGIKQNLTTFVPSKDNLKISILNLNNISNEKKKLKLIYYMKPVLGEDELKTSKSIDVNFQNNSNIICIQNKTNTDFKQISYLSCSEKIKSYTSSAKEFFGEGNYSNPEGLKNVSFSNKNNLGEDKKVIAYQIDIELNPFENKEVIFILGVENNILDCQDKAYKYTKISNVEEELKKAKDYWKNILEKVQVNTPIASFNILMNGWLIYQTLACRVNGRSGFYQSGGAFGFRDQLQDTIALKYFNKDLIKNQIIKHSKRQFIEGDVQHWWHEETNRGIRTKFSDDLLWLVYVVEEYINFTGDYSILDIETPYLQGEILDKNTDEKYDEYKESNIKESIFMHCERAIEKSLEFGENGLPKIGTGDWNDALNKVGNKGKGESVWLGFFLYDILQKWISIYKNIIQKLPENDSKIENMEQKIEKYKKILEQLKKALNTNAWDGRWYRRAFTDEGDILGSIQNEECKIDGISQSWGVISNAGDNDKKYISLESLENHLIDRENGIIKLLDPPFEKSSLEPGYIKAYLPGTRENGGQYTHAAVWAIIAETILGFGDKATELFRMINPIEHSKTKETSKKYKVEPYVIAADIYGQGNLSGRGGWTWYTGSSSWMYEAGLHYILGFTIKEGYLWVNPCIPKNWKEYKIHYKYENSIYNIHIKNPNGKNSGVDEVYLNRLKIDDKKIKLIDNYKVNEIEIIM